MKAITPDQIVEAVKNNDYGLSDIEIRLATHYLLRTNFNHFTLSMIGEYTGAHHVTVHRDIERTKELNLLVNVCSGIQAHVFLKVNKL